MKSGFVKYSKEYPIFQIPRCTIAKCKGVVKPDIVFFGENLPERFFKCVREDFKQCDLLIVLGTSLVVQPFASLIDRVGPHCPRLLINMEVIQSTLNVITVQQLKLLHPSFESGSWGVGQIGHVAQRQWAPAGEEEQLQRCRLAGRV